MRNRVINGFIATLGFLLSPLSWWNDLVFNIPIAYGFAFLFGLISEKLFFPMMIFGYWLTNIAGLILMHHGVKGVIHPGKTGHNKNELIKDIIFSILYTLAIAVLVKVGWLKFPTEYFK